MARARRYYAAVSYVDEHVGDIVSLLSERASYEESIIVFHSDHGYHLGEHGEWEKKSNFDLVVHVPLMIKAPRSLGAAPARTASITELIDVFPTLVALAGLPPPPGIDGQDLSQLFHTPRAELKSVAFHQYPACGCAALNTTRLSCNNVHRADFDFMGYSLRTKDWRYTLWLPWNGQTPDF